MNIVSLFYSGAFWHSFPYLAGGGLVFPIQRYVLLPRIAAQGKNRSLWPEQSEALDRKYGVKISMHVLMLCWVTRGSCRIRGLSAYRLLYDLIPIVWG